MGNDADQIGTPLIKWPGGKRALAASILQHVPKKFGRYYEPFFGGGALFFALRPKRAILADVNAELIECYQQVRDAPHDVIRILRRFRNDEASYYRVRDRRPRTPAGRAARFLYLMRLSFNGIHRVNLRGEFNVPYGKKIKLSVFDKERILQVSATLSDAILIRGDFAATTKDAKNGDVVYFDPPYTVAHTNNGFVKYNERIFSWSDQKRLAAHAKALANRGCIVIVSNAYHDSVSALYKEAKHIVIERQSVIAASNLHRRKIVESLFVLEG